MKIEHEEKKKIFESHLTELVTQVKENLHEDPKSKFGISMGANVIALINTLTGDAFEVTRMSIWEKGLGVTQINSMSPEITTWIETAMDAYWRNNIEFVLAKSDN